MAASTFLDTITAGMGELADSLDELAQAIDDRDAQAAMTIVERSRFWIKGLNNFCCDMQRAREGRGSNKLVEAQDLTNFGGNES